MLPDPGVTLLVPRYAHSHGPIPCHIKMVADMETYYANHGILDQALNVLLIRRDAPGVRFLDKIDPRVFMLADTPIEPPCGRSAQAPGRVCEERTLDPLEYGATLDGAGEYYVLATFASFWTEPFPLSIRHPTERQTMESFPLMPGLSVSLARALPEPPAYRGVLAQISNRDGLRVEGSLRTAVQPSRPSERLPPAFVTIVMQCLAPTGECHARSYVIDAHRDGSDLVAKFSVSLVEFAGPLGTGRYRLLVFSADEHAAALSVGIP